MRRARQGEGLWHPSLCLFSLCRPLTHAVLFVSKQTTRGPPCAGLETVRAFSFSVPLLVSSWLPADTPPWGGVLAPSGKAVNCMIGSIWAVSPFFSSSFSCSFPSHLPRISKRTTPRRAIRLCVTFPAALTDTAICPTCGGTSASSTGARDAGSLCRTRNQCSENRRAWMKWSWVRCNIVVAPRRRLCLPK